jgi:hypothetical protein
VHVLLLLCVCVYCASCAAAQSLQQVALCQGAHRGAVVFVLYVCCAASVHASVQLRSGLELMTEQQHSSIHCADVAAVVAVLVRSADTAMS